MRGGARVRSNKERFTVKEVEEALLECAGICAAAAERLKLKTGRQCSHSTVRKYLDRHPSLKEAVQQAVEVNLDLAETKLLSALNQGAEWAVKFYLEMKGRQRGYTRRTEIVGVASAPVVVTNARQWLIDELDGMESRHGPQPGGSNGPAAPRGEAPPNPETLH
jgi:hypothetical protein